MKWDKRVRKKAGLHFSVIQGMIRVKKYCLKNKSSRILTAEKNYSSIWSIVPGIKKTLDQLKKTKCIFRSPIISFPSEHNIYLNSSKTLRSHKTGLESKLDIPCLYQVRFACENYQVNFHQRKQYLKNKVPLNNYFWLGISYSENNLFLFIQQIFYCIKNLTHLVLKCLSCQNSPLQYTLCNMEFSKCDNN